MSGDAATPMDRAPCGCQFGQSGDAFVYEPCSLDCDLYAFVCDESARQGKPIRTIDAR